jgi:pyridoxine 5-phosphate synthase
MGIRLGVNVDHVATLRQARKAAVPDPVEVALLAEAGGADGITVHLREDRRHIQEYDLEGLKRRVRTKVNLEMAAQEEMVQAALQFHPEDVCLVPERREELTTEGGLSLAGGQEKFVAIVERLRGARIRVTAFLDPEPRQIELAREIGFDAVEIHTGAYANAGLHEREKEIERVHEAANRAHDLGLEVHAGHGLDYENVRPIVGTPWLRELNIGHSIVARSVLVGIEMAVREMKTILKTAEAGSKSLTA